MIRHEQRATLLERQITTNSYNEQIVNWAPMGFIDVVIGYKGGVFMDSNDVMTTNYTITGLTNDKRPKEEDKIEANGKTYLIHTIIETGRKRILSLVEDKQIA